MTETSSTVNAWPLEVVISGGQTGADQAALRAAKALGYGTYGFAPRSWRTEIGPQPELGAIYGLVESRFTEYYRRTAQNVRHADATVVFKVPPVLGVRSGSQFTINECIAQGKPCFVFPLSATLQNTFDVESKVIALRAFIREHGVTVLNVAGPRESVTSGIGAWVEGVMRQVLAR